MEVSQYSLLILCIASFVFGAILGIGYDALAILPVIFGKCYNKNLKEKLSGVKMPLTVPSAAEGKLLSVAEFLHDLALMICAGGLVALVLYRFNDGAFRAVSPLLFAAGFFVYRALLRRFVLPLSEISGFLVKYIFSLAAFLVTFPLRAILRIVKKLWKRQKAAMLQKRITEYTKKEKSLLLRAADTSGCLDIDRRGNFENGKKKNEYDHPMGDSCDPPSVGNSNRSQHHAVQPKDAGGRAARKRKRSA